MQEGTTKSPSTLTLGAADVEPNLVVAFLTLMPRGVA